MKKFLSLAGLLVVVAAVSLGCQKKETTTTTKDNGRVKQKQVTTTYEYQP